MRLKSGPLSLVYWRWEGQRGQTPVLLLHGGLDHARAWDETCAALAADRPVLALDLRGHGDSDWSPEGAYDPPYYLIDIVALLKLVGPCHIVAHSMGANLTLRLAAAMPDLMQRLVLVEGVLGEGLFRADKADVDPRMQAWVDEMKLMAAASPAARTRMWLEQRAALAAFPTRHYRDIDEAVDRLLDDQDKRLSPAQARHLAETGMKRVEGGLVWKFDPLVRGRFAIDFTATQMAELWRAAPQPMLHIYGSRSWAYPLDPDQRAHFPNAEFAVIEGAGHWVHLNQPQQFIARVREFLREGKNERL
ncbi:MAG: alpha/beta hydrolase [Hyphomonadaceae bacterium]|nr:alpha/beta hydrolase [Hyphomonadaceae bacterium]